MKEISLNFDFKSKGLLNLYGIPSIIVLQQKNTTLKTSYRFSDNSYM